MDPFNRTINYHIKGIQVSPQLANSVKLMLVTDDVICTLRSSKDAKKCFCHKSNLKLNFQKSISYTLHQDRIHLPEITSNNIIQRRVSDPSFIYLGIPFNKINWPEQLRKIYNKIFDLPLQTRILFINTYSYSQLYYLDQHDSCPKQQLNKQHIKNIKKKIFPHTTTAAGRERQKKSFFNVTQQRLETPLHLGDFHQIRLQQQMAGRKAFYIFHAIVTPQFPSNINIRYAIKIALLEVIYLQRRLRNQSIQQQKP
ncbi:unnamed protein product [Ambrosiozyma monospora]|uniref:Unnamed protein product n=1 Tax=Ambrosiozyma monospora TaxID=43982 RepID=A0ACB5T6H5_AMBMO|nr:unnamed protein product [Ambrosiozyma monospora]